MNNKPKKPIKPKTSPAPKKAKPIKPHKIKKIGTSPKKINLNTIGHTYKNPKDYHKGY